MHVPAHFSAGSEGDCDEAASLTQPFIMLMQIPPNTFIHYHNRLHHKSSRRRIRDCARAEVHHGTQGFEWKTFVCEAWNVHFLSKNFGSGIEVGLIERTESLRTVHFVFCLFRTTVTLGCESSKALQVCVASETKRLVQNKSQLRCTNCVNC